MNAAITAKQVKELRDRTGVGMAKCKEALEEALGDMELAITILRKAGMASAVKKEGRETNEGVIKFYNSDAGLAIIEVNAETDFVVKNERFQEFASDLAKEVALTRPVSIEEFSHQKYSKDPNLTIDQYRAVMIQSLGENLKIRKIEFFPSKPNTSLGIYSHGGGKLVTLVELQGSSNQQDLAKDIAMHIAAESPEYLSPEEVPERIKEHEKEIARAQITNKPAAILEKIVEGKLKSYYAQACLLLQQYVKDNSITIDQLVQQKSKEANTPLKIVQFLRWHVGG